MTFSGGIKTIAIIKKREIREKNKLLELGACLHHCQEGGCGVNKLVIIDDCKRDYDVTTFNVFAGG